MIFESSGDSRAGSCDSPNGDIVCDDLTGYPDGAYLTANGCCFNISPPVKNATYCWEFTAVNTSLVLDCGWSIIVFNSFSSWFSDFELYTCTPDCLLVGTGLSFTGLTVGTCYTWCFDTHMTGGGAGGGFNKLCPYVIQTPLLPVELASFYGIPGENNIQLIWQTESELNCSAFDIMRSTDGLNYEMIGRIMGNGTTNSTHTYSFQDNAPIDGENYYMLRQLDFNGNENYSNTISCYPITESTEFIYYNLMGELIETENPTAGIYIEEIITENNKIRHLIYKW